MKSNNLILKISLSIFLLVGLFGLSAKVQAATISERLPILMYHYIETPPATTTLPNLYVTPKIFESQLQEIKKLNCPTLFMSEAAINLRAHKPLAKNSVALTFDDGYEDFYTQAFPLLKKYQIKATIYIIINRFGQKDYLTKDQVKEMATSGLVEIGSHTFNHPDLRKLKDKETVFEIKDSRRVLQQISGQAVLTFAYPYGDYTIKDLAVASSSGYLAAVSVDPGVKQTNDNIFLLHRLRPNSLSGKNFVRWLMGWII